ncbi:hypothetical protein ACFYNY_24385 [Streptomyces sp. NPDC006530]|uniref:hypothetical protein n=1 Tax=Streptomyces sp. NPDC006530 TaxID=3364750 RepID=UPI0036AC94A0
MPEQRDADAMTDQEHEAEAARDLARMKRLTELTRKHTKAELLRISYAVAFVLVHAGADLTGWPYERRRAALEALFADHGLAAPLTLCPATTDTAVAAQWLEWTV